MDTQEEIQHPAIRSAMEYLDMHNVRLTYESDLPAKSGLGTSSSFVVGMLSSFYALKGQYVDKKGWRMRPSTLSGKCAGKQEDGRDRIAAAFGGLNRIDFRGNGYEVHPLIMSRQKQQLNDRLLMYFTGFTGFPQKSRKESDSRREKTGAG